MIRPMPVLSQHDGLEPVLQLVQGRNNLVAPLYPQRTAGAEIILHINHDQRFTHPVLLCHETVPGTDRPDRRSPTMKSGFPMASPWSATVPTSFTPLNTPQHCQKPCNSRERGFARTPARKRYTERSLPSMQTY